MDELVEVSVRSRRRGSAPTQERLRALLVAGDRVEGTYELASSSSLVPLVAGDVVRAELAADGFPQVTGWVRSGPRVQTEVELDPSRCDVEQVLARWTVHGALRTEERDGRWLTTWTLGLLEVADVIDADQARGHAFWLRTSLPGDRGPLALRDVDLWLDPAPQLGTVATDYWTGDDEFWRAQRVDDVDFLVHVQLLAWRDADVARALERGEHGFLVRDLSAEDEPAG